MKHIAGIPLFLRAHLKVTLWFSFRSFFGGVAHLAIKHLGFSLVQTKFHLGPDVLEIALDREIINCNI